MKEKQFLSLLRQRRNYKLKMCAKKRVFRVKGNSRPEKSLQIKNQNHRRMGSDLSSPCTCHGKGTKKCLSVHYLIRELLRLFFRTLLCGDSVFPRYDEKHP